MAWIYNAYCKFNDFVICNDQHACKKCGWNPIVDEERHEKVKEEHMTIKRKD